MKHEIFFFPPAKAEHTVCVFAALGRALALATRFEAGCRSLSALIDLRENPAPLRSDEALRTFSNRIASSRLFETTERISQYATVDVFEVLVKARRARNHIVHEQSLRFEHWVLDETAWHEALATLFEDAKSLATGERLVSLAASVLTKEDIPTKSSLDDYPEMIARWVCTLE